MKVFKIIFTLIIIGLIVFAIYTIYNNEKEKKGQAIEPSSQIEVTRLTDIRIGIAEVDTINPILSNNKNIQDISRFVFDSLLTIDKDYKIQPSLATEYSKLDDNSYILKLRQDVKWHNGANFNAYDVKFTVDKLKDISSVYSYNIKDVIGLQVIDEYTIKLYLNGDIPFFEYNLIFPILSDKDYENEDFVNSVKNTTPLGTGMYKFLSNENGVLSLAKNDSYWDIKEGFVLDKITINMYSSMGEVYNAFKIGNIDLINTSSINVEEYIGSMGYRQKEVSGREFDFISINCENSILKNQEVRKALSYAIDKNNIVSSVYKDKYFISEFPLNYGSWLYNVEEDTLNYNPDKVSEIMTESGWTLSNNVWRKTIGYNTIRTNIDLVVQSNNEKRIAVAEIIKGGLAQVRNKY